MPRYELAKTLQQPDAFYWIGKLVDWACESGTGAYLGAGPIEELRINLANLKAEIANAGLNPEKEPAGIVDELPLVNYALDELEKLAQGRTAEISSRRAALVFVEFLWLKFEQFQEMAEALDAEQPAG